MAGDTGGQNSYWSDSLQEKDVDENRHQVQRRAILLIGDPALTCHIQQLAIDDLSLFYRYSYGFCSSELTSIIPCTITPMVFFANLLVTDYMEVQRRATRLIGDPASTCHLHPLSHRRVVTSHSSTGIHTDSAPPI
nr:unnamed protein product [Callosobruchus chinensis]